MRYWLILTILLLSTPVLGQFQEPYSSRRAEDIQLWLDYNPSLQLQPHARLAGQLGLRTVFPNEFYRGFTRLNYRFTPKKLYERKRSFFTFEFHGGAAYFHTLNLNTDDISEIRPFQGILVSFPSTYKFRLMHYVRFEERFEYDHDADFWNFNARMRYRLGTTFGFKGPVMMHFYIPVNAEFFFALDRGIQFNDVFRTNAGFGSYLTERHRLEFLVSYHLTRNTSEGIFQTDDLVFRLRFFHLLGREDETPKD